MFIFHIAETLGLIALTGGVALYLFGVRTGGKGTGFAKFFGIIIMLLSIFSILCAAYFAGSSWYFKNRMGMAMHGNMMMPMMQQGKSLCYCSQGSGTTNMQSTQPETQNSQSNQPTNQ